MRPTLTLMLLGLASCQPAQPWPMGLWEGELTLVGLDGVGLSTEHFEAEVYFLSLALGFENDDGRLAFHADSANRRIDLVNGTDHTNLVARTFIDGGTYVAQTDLIGSGPRGLGVDIGWTKQDAGIRPDPTVSPLLFERGVLTRTGDWHP